MSHGSQCDCVMCSAGKKMGFIKNQSPDEHDHSHHDHSHDENQPKKYACASCGSQSDGTPGTCCGAERNEA